MVLFDFFDPVVLFFARDRFRKDGSPSARSLFFSDALSGRSAPRVIFRVEIRLADSPDFDEREMSISKALGFFMRRTYQVSAQKVTKFLA